MTAIVHRNAARRLLVACLSSLLLCGLAHAGSAPSFTAKTLDGQTVSSDSFRGNVVLLQFWTTWCPVCHEDQAAVDSVQSAFGGEGLVVLAIDDSEPVGVIRSYLQKSPRSVQIVVGEDRSLAARFGVHSYPHYVVIDRNGNIAANRAGGGGEAYLRALLRSAGIPRRTETMQASQGQAPAPPTGPRLVDVPLVQNTTLAKPIPKTVFVFTDGEKLEADHYELRANFLHVSAEGQDRSIPLSVLDIPKTIAVNRERGINLKIPTHANEVFLAF